MHSPRNRLSTARAVFDAACPPWRKKRLSFESLESRTLLSGNVVINEIHYNPNIDYEAVEFIELTNSGDAPSDLSGAKFTNGIDYTFPAGTSLAPGAFLVIAANPGDVLTKFGITALGPWSGKLSNEGEKLTLKDAGGTTLDEVTYGVGFPWPVTGDYGDSIELINPTFDNSVPGNWRASSLNVAATLLDMNSTWRYRKGTSEPPTAWKLPTFSEATDPVSWQSGQTSIGYGDGDDLTNLSDMEDAYSTVYLRNTFNIVGTVPTTLTLRLYVDDGAIIYINGVEVNRSHVSTGTKAYNALATDHEAVWETITLSNMFDILKVGTNTIAVQVINSTLNSSDLSFDCQLIVPVGGSRGATPGGVNSDFAATTPPLLDKLKQSVQQPVAGQDMVISIKATDSDGMQSVVLQYQTVDAGNYIRLTDAAYQTSWISVAMHDDGLNGDAAAFDGVYSVTLPAAIQVNRRLVRYRITATDSTNASIRIPYTSDTQPNFAYYVYNGVPAWTGANQPGVTAPVTFGTDITNSLPVYQLIANPTDVNNSQYVSNFNDMPFYATMVYDGVVYDDIIFTNRGEFSTYISGKNKWAIKFNTGHLFAARDNYGNLYSEKWRRIDLNANAEPWLMVNRGMAGLDESVSFRLFQLAGIPASNTNYVQFRVVDGAAEAPADQYSGDMWGLYLAVEHTGSHWLDEHDLPDGNVYEIANGAGDPRSLSPDQVSDGSDWTNLLANIKLTTTPQSYWENNIDLEEFYSFNAISRATSNVDLRPTYNHVMYHAPDGHWEIVPWDLDMMMVPETHQLGQTYLNNMLTIPALKTEYANRARELLDLLFSDKSRTGGQVAQVVDEYARFLDPSDGAGNYLNGWAELDQYMWNYNPHTTSDHKGTFYKTPLNDTRFGGTWTRTLSTPDFEGMVNYLINFMTDTDPNSWAVGDGDQRGYGFNYLESEAADPNIPATPTVGYTGTVNFPSDKVKFTSSAYTDPNASPFATMEWRVGEISNPGTPGFDPDAPWKYEIDSVWESGEQSAFNSQIMIPAGVLQTGHTYRVRVRYKDNTGRWSHWSDVAAGATQFTATAPVGLIQTSLRLTELNYNPAANGVLPGTAADNNDYEFIEFKNFGSQSINLQNLSFTTGITMTFGDVSLAPGESGVVVRSLDGFQSRYGTVIKVLGVYSGSLDNGGERVVLMNSDGTPLKDFTYDDTGTGWYPTTDGGGATLVVRSPASNPDLSSAANWRASFQLGGSPGSDETVPHITGVTVLGSTWTGLPNGYAIPAGAGQAAILPWAGIDRIKITFDQNVTVAQANMVVQSSVLPTATYGIGGFTYDAVTFTAIWNLTLAIGADRIRINVSDTVHGSDNFNLDGDWNGKAAYPSGDGFTGGAFVFDLNVLPGDVDRNGVVQAADGLGVRNLLGAAAGDGNFSSAADVNGNGVIQASDGLLVRNVLGTSLPAASFGGVTFGLQFSPLVAVATGLVARPAGIVMQLPATLPVAGGAEFSIANQPVLAPVPIVPTIILPNTALLPATSPWAFFRPLALHTLASSPLSDFHLVDISGRLS